MLIKLVKLNNFKSIYSLLLPVSVLAMAIFFALGLRSALITSPIDYQQFDAVRIMYIHVPCAWMSLMIYSFMALSNLSGFIWKNQFSYLVAKSIAPIGAIFTAITLVTGSIWGKPIWGTWWVWDARLTSVLILFFLYLGYIILINAFDDISKGEKIAAIISIIGFINIPIIKFSVEFWNSLHQPASIIRSKGIAIAPEMLEPLLLMFGAFFFYFVFFALIGIKNNININKLKRLNLYQI
ncbi:MAG: heme transporter HemC [Rickettsiaceae bacterium]|jgi:heme exporter protein C|nr:heme transporter HemC [Rickettsiaceae bacterium]